jgi:hypothetical protein
MLSLARRIGTVATPIGEDKATYNPNENPNNDAPHLCDLTAALGSNCKDDQWIRV